MMRRMMMRMLKGIREVDDEEVQVVEQPALKSIYDDPQ
jgi:hypothetical protein